MLTNLIIVLLTPLTPPSLSVSLSLCFQDPKEALAQSVLAEVPGQVVDFFNMLKLSPLNSSTPVAGSDGQVKLNA